MSPLELIQDAEALAGMSAGEQLYAGGQVAVLGMFIVFSILLLLFLTIKVIETFAGSDGQAVTPGASGSKTAVSDQPSPAPSPAPAAEKEDGLDPEIIAAITASLQAFYEERGGRFRILRVKKRSRPLPAWMREIESESEAVDITSESKEVK